MKKTIIKNDKMELVNWYGFWPSKVETEENCYIDIFAGIPNEMALYLNGEEITRIDYGELLAENAYQKKAVHTENEIWNFIYKECRKYVKNKKIYINAHVEEFESVAGDSEFLGFKTIEEIELEGFLDSKE